MRKAVTFLQSASTLCRGGRALDPELIGEISGKVPEQVMTALWLAFSGRSFEKMKQAVEDIVADGYSVASVLELLYARVVAPCPSTSTQTDELSTTSQKKPALTGTDKAHICEKIAQVESNFAEGASESLQVTFKRACVYVHTHHIHSKHSKHHFSFMRKVDFIDRDTNDESQSNVS